MPRRKPYDQQALGWVTTHAEHRKWESKRERPIKNSGPALFSGVDWNEESRSVRAVRRFTKLLGGGIEA